MQLKAEQLQSHLSGTLSPVYLISGDEPLLVQEAADAVRSAAREQGFSERELMHAEAGFDWNTLLTEANSLSLFAERKLIEVRLPTGKPGDKGARALQEYVDNLNPDTLLLLVSPKLDASAKRSKWVKALDAAGAMVQIWPVTPAQLPRWLERRLRARGIKANRQAIEILADRVEGNLLAAVQEIEKLALLAPDGSVDGATMSTVVADSARFNVFDLVDRALAGDATGACRTLRGLLEEGTEPIVILWSLTKEARILLKAANRVAAGNRADSVLPKLGVWEKRQPLFKTALRNLNPATLRYILRLAAGVDKAIKGVRKGDVDSELTTLVLMLSGNNPLQKNSLVLGLEATTTSS